MSSVNWTKGGLESLPHEELVSIILELQEQAGKDPLTGLPNRREFMEQAMHHFAFAKRYKLPLTLLFIDLDDFKTKINDKYGHAVGDDVLKTTSKVLFAETRESDVLARHGGDEFLVLMPNASPADGEKLAARIREHIFKNPIEISAFNELIHIGVTIGICQRTEKMRSVEDLIKSSDEKMLMLKRKFDIGR